MLTAPGPQKFKLVFKEAYCKETGRAFVLRVEFLVQLFLITRADKPHFSL